MESRMLALEPQVRFAPTPDGAAVDRLVAAEWAEGVSSRVLLCDDAGGRVDIAARVLTGTPLWWHTVEEGVRHSRARGTLRTGNDDLRRLARCIDTDTARGVFQASGLG